MTTPGLVDIFVTSEGILEQKLCACLILVPDEVLKASGDFKIEVNNSAKYFWNQVQDRKELILKSSPDEQIEICFTLIYKRDPKSFWRWFYLLGDENSIEAIPIILAEIQAIRGNRKLVRYLETNKTITRIFDERFNRWE